MCNDLNSNHLMNRKLIVEILIQTIISFIDRTKLNLTQQTNQQNALLFKLAKS